MTGINTVRNRIIISIITTIIPFLIQLIIGFVVLNNGEIIIHEDINTNSENIISSISINNYSDNLLENIVINVPGTLLEDNVIISQPINYYIEKSQLYIQNISENSKIHLIISYKKHHDSLITISNFKKNKLEVIYNSEKKHPFITMFKIISFSAILYSIITYFAYYKINNLINKMKNNLYEEIDKLKDLGLKAQEENKNLALKLEENKLEFNNEHNRINKEIENTKNRLVKYQMLLLKTISDHKKELAFWKDTIRKLIGRNKQTEVNEIFNFITNNLKTYTVRSSVINGEIDRVNIIEDILRDKDTE